MILKFCWLSILRTGEKWSTSLSLWQVVHAYTNMMVILKGAALRRLDVNLLETNRHPNTPFAMSLCIRHPTPYSCLSSSPLKYALCPSSVDISPKLLQRISQSPVQSSGTCPLHLKVSQLTSEFSNSGSNRDVLSTANFLKLCYTSSIPVS